MVSQLGLGRQLSALGRAASAIACTLLLLPAFACGGGDEEEPTAGTTSMPVMEKGQRKVTVPGTENDPVPAVVAAGEIPDGFPDDIPLPASVEPQNAMIIPSQGGLVTFTSDADRKSVFDEFHSGLSGRGWTLETEEDDLRSMIRATKGARKAGITVASGENGTEVAVSFEGS